MTRSVIVVLWYSAVIVAPHVVSVQFLISPSLQRQTGSLEYLRHAVTAIANYTQRITDSSLSATEIQQALFFIDLKWLWYHVNLIGV
jgi:hypothetical protein